MLGHNVDAAERASWMQDSGDQTILVDAGLGLDPDLQRPRAGHLIRRLAAADIELGSVTDVVLTHMHMDHGGLLVEGDEEQLRPTELCRRNHSDTWAQPTFTFEAKPILVAEP